jgi:hypothetical protein
MQVQKVYYKSMRSVSAPLTLLLFLPFTFAGPSQAPTTSKGSAVDSHEGLTITAEPWTSPEQYKTKFRKKSPYAAGAVAIRVSFRNDTSDTIRVNLDRIRLNLNLGDDNRQELQPLTPQELADVVVPPRGDPSATRSRFPIPLPVPRGSGRDKHWTEFKKEAEEASVPGGMIAPHSTVQGLLYFDLQNQFDLLNSARLYIPDLVSLEKNRALLYFDLDLSRASAQ